MNELVAFATDSNDLFEEDTRRMKKHRPEAHSPTQTILSALLDMQCDELGKTVRPSLMKLLQSDGNISLLLSRVLARQQWRNPPSNFISSILEYLPISSIQALKAVNRYYNSQLLKPSLWLHSKIQLTYPSFFSRYKFSFILSRLSMLCDLTINVNSVLSAKELTDISSALSECKNIRCFALRTIQATDPMAPAMDTLIPTLLKSKIRKITFDCCTLSTLKLLENLTCIPLLTTLALYNCRVIAMNTYLQTLPDCIKDLTLANTYSDVPIDFNSLNSLVKAHSIRIFGRPWETINISALAILPLKRIVLPSAKQIEFNTLCMHRSVVSITVQDASFLDFQPMSLLSCQILELSIGNSTVTNPDEWKILNNLVVLKVFQWRRALIEHTRVLIQSISSICQISDELGSIVPSIILDFEYCDAKTHGLSEMSSLFDPVARHSSAFRKRIKYVIVPADTNMKDYDQRWGDIELLRQSPKSVQVVLDCGCVQVCACQN